MLNPASDGSAASFSHRQQKRRRLVESGGHQLDLVDEFVDSAGHLLASACQAVGVLLQLGQARLRAAGFDPDPWRGPP